ncbi:MAG: mannose-6-phosphate isomerase, class I [Actinomycetota bacterium]
MPAAVAPLPLNGFVQHYAWGDPTFIPEFLHVAPTGEPWAELWLGTHPSGPTQLDGRPLVDEIGELPYLLKVLAAAEPLSMQAHPTTAQAIDGFGRGIYPDDRAKPELLCALTPFEALCGLRPVDATLDLLDDLGASDLAAAVRNDGLGGTLDALYRGRFDPTSTIAACDGSDRVEAVWARKLNEMYPGQVSIAVTLLLNHVHLEPGQAIHLTAGNLHAYLRGAGVELMGASDNVVRGGLTVKHVDVDELLHIVDRSPLAEPVMLDAAAAGRYPLPEVGVTLTRIEANTAHASAGREIAICLDGTTWYLPHGSEYRRDATSYVVV